MMSDIDQIAEDAIRNAERARMALDENSLDKAKTFAAVSMAKSNLLIADQLVAIRKAIEGQR